MSAATKTAVAPVATQVPAIRHRWPGLNGTYAGVAAGVGGAPDHHLVLLDDKPAERMNWKDSLAWAKTMGADLPTRDESALLYAHLRDQFEPGYHWTSTQYSDDFAWLQNFVTGYQGDLGKDDEVRARVVRRLPLQSFNPSTSGA